MDKQLHAGNTLFEAFVEQVKQVLEHLYDFAFLQQHALARHYDGTSDSSAKSAGRHLRFDLINAVEALKPLIDSGFHASEGRLYNILHLLYVENLTVQEAAGELGLSERQVYRDLKRGQEGVAAILWDRYESQPPLPKSETGFSLQSEMDRLKVKFAPVDIAATFQQARGAVSRLAQQHGVDLVSVGSTPMLSTDAALAYQILVSVLSYAIQQAEPGALTASFRGEPGATLLTLSYAGKPDHAAAMDSAIAKLAGRLHWRVTCTQPALQQQIELHMNSSSKIILVIDDNEGWIALIERFLEGLDCSVTSLPDAQPGVDQIARLAPSAIILDVMMPDTDGWEILQRLRAQPATADLPILVCTVFNDAQLAYSLGASSFLPKPADREHLLQALRELNVI